METEGLSGSLTCLRWQTWGWRQGLASAKLRTRELPCGSHVFSLASDQFNNLSSLLSLWPLPSSFACGIFSRRMLNCSQTAAARGRGGSGTSALVSGASSSCHGVTYLDRPVPGAVSTRGRCSDFVFELPPLFEACLSEQRVPQSQVTETEEEAEDA